MVNIVAYFVTICPTADTGNEIYCDEMQQLVAEIMPQNSITQLLECDKV